MKKIKSVVIKLKDVNEMSYTRGDFIRDLRNKMAGMTKEYTKYLIAEDIGKTRHLEDWDRELKDHAKIVNIILSKKSTIKSKSRPKAISEALSELRLSSKIHQGKNKMLKYYKDDFKKIESYDYNTEVIIKKMVSKYLPEIYKFIDY